MMHAIFDLDGTISDPAEGITRSINHALVALGAAAQPRDELLRYIGPPLTRPFAELLPDPSTDSVAAAIALYRERYGRVGYAENVLYPGIRRALTALRSNGWRLHIATSKREDFATKVLEHFDIKGLFASVHGCDLDRTKTGLLRDILATAENGRAVMVGDRDSDFESAREAGIPSVGVGWGYGSAEELALAGLVVARPSDLPQAVAEAFKQAFERTSEDAGRST